MIAPSEASASIESARGARRWGVGRYESVERTARLSWRNVRVDLSGAAVSVTEQDLNDAHRSALLHQMRSEGMTQCARRNRLADSGAARGNLDCALNGGVVDRARGVLLVREEKAGRTSGAPPLTQQIEDHGRKRSETILVSFTLTDAEQHAGRVDVVYAQTADL